MTAVFYSAFLSVLFALAKICCVALIAGLLIRKKILPQSSINVLSRLTVTVLLPCLIFSNILQHFDPDRLCFWWLIPLLSVLMIGIGMGAASILFAKELSAKKNMLPLAGMQNAGYLVLPLGKILYPDQFDEFSLYCFLFILGMTPLLWSIGKVLTTTGSNSSFSVKGLFTPPLLANLAAITLVLAEWKFVIPDQSLYYIGIIGEVTIPVATFILGATLGDISLRTRPPWIDTGRVILVKFLLLPVITIYLLTVFSVKELYPVLANLLVIQSSSPAATAIILQIRAYGGNYQATGNIMFVSYLFCMFALPFWLAMWQIL